MNKSSFLEKIRRETNARVREAKERTPIETLHERIKKQRPAIDLKKRILSSREPHIIAEVKKRSPSHGVIANGVDAVAVAKAYVEAGAMAISVLTEPNYFGGSLEDLEKIREALPETPLLRKDFILDPYQVVESRAYGADAVLLIHAFVGQDRLRKLYGQALELGMTPLVEVHNDEEFEGALRMGAQVIGVNNRDLNTLKVDLATSRRLARFKPASCLMIAESGIETKEQIAELKGLGYEAFLVGTHLMKNKEPGQALRMLIEGVT